AALSRSLNFLLPSCEINLATSLVSAFLSPTARRGAAEPSPSPTIRARIKQRVLMDRYSFDTIVVRGSWNECRTRHETAIKGYAIMPRRRRPGLSPKQFGDRRRARRICSAVRALSLYIKVFYFNDEKVGDMVCREGDFCLTKSTPKGT